MKHTIIIFLFSLTLSVFGQDKYDYIQFNKLTGVIGTDNVIASMTEDKFFTRTGAVNHQTGTIVITGHYDSNGNGKYDQTDKNEILIYNLKTIELKTKI